MARPCFDPDAGDCNLAVEPQFSQQYQWPWPRVEWRFGGQGHFNFDTGVLASVLRKPDSAIAKVTGAIRSAQVAVEFQIGLSMKNL